MDSSSNNPIFIGPLKPGQKPSSPPPRDDSWSIYDMLKEPGSEVSGIGKIRKPKKFVRAAGGTVWEDPSLAEWDPNDYRVFCGDLGNDVTDELLASVFGKYTSFVKAKVIRDKKTNKSKGYGFISFKDPSDYAKAIREWDGKYIGCRPVKLRKSQWRDRSFVTSKVA